MTMKLAPTKGPRQGGRTGTIEKYTAAAIELTLNEHCEVGEIRTTGKFDKVDDEWTFTATDASGHSFTCAIWDYRGSGSVMGRYSTGGPDHVFKELFGRDYSPFRFGRVD
jgi:hypothetical protein